MLENSFFGQWITDEFGLPAFEYTCSQGDDENALWEGVPGKFYRTHWHQLGNDRITALATNDGQVTVFTYDKYPQYLNYYHKKKNNFSGGFGWINDGKESFCTNYAFRPQGVPYRRIFGSSYYLKEFFYHDLDIKQRIFCPFGNFPLIISSVVITNKSSTERTLNYFEYWDLNPLLLIFLLPRRLQHLGSSFIRRKIDYDKENQCLMAVPTGRKESSPRREKPSLFDRQAPLVFLTALQGKVIGFEADKKKFFGRGDINIPEKVKEGSCANSLPSSSSDILFVMQMRADLKPGESEEFIFAYGYSSNKKEALDNLTTLKKARLNLFENHIKKWKDFLPEVDLPREPEISRELIWDAYYLRSSVLYDSYVRRFFIPQGGNYLFYRGFNGATRDLCQHALAMIYLQPEIVKEVLGHLLSYMDYKGRLPYDLTCYGKANLCKLRPSDFSFWLFLLISEYILFTKDFTFLLEEFPFYPLHKGKTGTVLEHLEKTFRYTKDKVGTGRHGILRMLTNDWNDEIAINAGGLLKAPGIIWKGESTFNQALAVFVLPRFLDLLSRACQFFKDNELEEKNDEVKNLIDEIEEWHQFLVKNLKKQWTGEWFNRGYLGNGKVFGENLMFLEPQPFPLLVKDILSEEQRDKLIENIEKYCMKSSPIGAAVVSHPEKRPTTQPGVLENGGVWYAINGPLIYALSLSRPDLAWREFKKMTLSAHSQHFPKIWYGQLSGPDAYNSFHSPRHGQAGFAHLPIFHTPLLGAREFPVMNTHSHSWLLWCFFKLCGIGSGEEKSNIPSKIPIENFSFKNDVLEIKCSQGIISFKKAN